MEDKIIHFENKETKVSINVPLDKHLIFIYGKNGSGKTTFSKSDDLDSKYVFNEDFIRKHVYIIDNDGPAINSETKKQFSELFIGEKVVELKKLQEKISEHKTECKNNLKILTENINKKYLEYQVKSPINKQFINEIKTNSVSYNPNEYKYEELLFSYENLESINQTLTSDKEFNEAILKIKSSQTISILLNSIKSDKLLNDILFGDENGTIKEINEKIMLINKNGESVKDIEEFLKHKNTTKTDLEIINKIISIQKRNDSECILCGAEYNADEIMKWEKAISDKNSEAVSKIKSLMTNTLKQIKYILISEKDYASIAKKTINNLNSISLYITNYIKQIDSDIYKEFNIDIEKNNELIYEINDLINGVERYLFKTFEKEYGYNTSLKKQIDSELEKTKTKIEEQMDNDLENYQNQIKCIIAKLGLDKEIRIKIDKTAGKLTYLLEAGENGVSTLSDGQKHKLALAIFFSYLASIDFSGQTIVLDDPVISLDEYSYFLLFSYIVNDLLKKSFSEDPVLIILTHNFSYLYAQINNIIDNKKYRSDAKVMYLSPSKIKEIDFDIFKQDDISLFKKILANMSCQNDLILLSSLYEKILREFVDLRLRVIGKDAEDKLEVEIDNCFTEKSKCVLLHKNASSLKKFSTKHASTYNECIQGLKELKECVNVLGFSEYISDTDIKKASALPDKSIDNTSIEYDILKLIASILINDELKYYVNYLSHPRISYTKNMFSSFLDLDK